MMNKNIICKNCNKPYHTLKNCKYPITSYGIIAFRFFNENLQYLMIRRKNSFGYIDFIKGQYSENNLEYLQKLFDEMSTEEKTFIETIDDFDILWKKMWEDNTKSNIFSSSKQKFNNLKDTGIITHLIHNSHTNWVETEWEFPKGRRNYMEKDLDCAFREFQEETGIQTFNLNLIQNLLPFEETFIGTNDKVYKNKYFLALSNVHDDADQLINFQLTEVSKMEWKNLNECICSMRPYNLEKINLINNIQEIITNYLII